MYATAAHLLIRLYHRGLTRVTDRDIHGWIAEPAAAPPRWRNLIHYTQHQAHTLAAIRGRFREIEAARLPAVDLRLTFLNVLVVAAPLFGLLGTVLGMLLTFRAIGVGGSSTSEIIARGISEALVATQTGMMVAIPGLLAAFVAKRWRNEYFAFLTRLEGATLRQFRRARHGARRLAAPVSVPTAPEEPEIAAEPATA
jgi:biopolymer transport protein ExbB